ncbi:hypothetical protein PJV92_06580 [Aliarcobacter butzleri]|uniref:Uncharacterized protein n=1 Tax=Aliarcobacter butzleri TaxID=28197 RepID=A0AAP4PYN0_9BACT|nr:hypothetical protein [Aliarcobacter butzleri]MDN5052192.1 hypothetical protein [Aliarcobacter butzleri]MDN5116450.1 hypothetical protein [Aliarcobacter butzleri]MDN5132387.1 hypothetical protein [Aliarcobacter butzleri]
MENENRKIEYAFENGRTEYAFSNIIFYSNNKDDFENLKKSLQLDKSLGLEKETLNMESIYELRNGTFDLYFLDKSKGTNRYSEENPFLQLYDGKDNSLNLVLDEKNFTINLKIEDSHMLGCKFGNKNEYIKNTIKDIAKQNNSQLMFFHSEQRFADSIGITVSLNETSKFDKDGKEVESFNFEDFHKNINQESVKELETITKDKSLLELTKESFKMNTVKEFFKDIIPKLKENIKNEVTFIKKTFKPVGKYNGKTKVNDKDIEK